MTIFGKDNFKATQWAMQGNSRIGATVKGDMLEGRFEFGVTSDGSGGNVSARRLYGVWNFTEGWGLKVGKDYTPITFFLSGQVFDSDAGLLQVGNAYGSRRGQLAVEGKLGPGMFKFAAIDPDASQISFTDISRRYGRRDKAEYPNRVLLAQARDVLPDEVRRQHECACFRWFSIHKVLYQ